MDDAARNCGMHYDTVAGCGGLQLAVEERTRIRTRSFVDHNFCLRYSSVVFLFLPCFVRRILGEVILGGIAVCFVERGG